MSEPKIYEPLQKIRQTDNFIPTWEHPLGYGSSVLGSDRRRRTRRVLNWNRKTISESEYEVHESMYKVSESEYEVSESVVSKEVS